MILPGQVSIENITRALYEIPINSKEEKMLQFSFASNPALLRVVPALAQQPERHAPAGPQSGRETVRGLGRTHGRNS
jgi:hypothetical protein